MKKVTRGSIVDATLGIISSQGFQGLTIRRIAQSAGVNVAAINYHFGSKEALIEEALKLFQEKTKKVFSVLMDQNLDPAERIKDLAYQFSDHMMTYPGFLKTFIASVVLDREPPEAAISNIVQYRNLMLDLLKDYLGKDDDTLKNVLVQFVSAIIYPVIIADKMEELYGIPFQDKKCREQYIDQLMDTFNLYMKS